MPETGLFGEEYFDKNYSDYDRQNPQKKLGFYRTLAEAAVSGKKSPYSGNGRAFGKFLGSLDPRWRKSGMDISDFAIVRARGLVLTRGLSSLACLRCRLKSLSTS